MDERHDQFYRMLLFFPEIYKQSKGVIFTALELGEEEQSYLEGLVEARDFIFRMGLNIKNAPPSKFKKNLKSNLIPFKHS